MKNMWEWLEIEPTTDKKAIKKAYAAQVKNCHQEDEPERWSALHDAYQRALKYAGRSAVAVDLADSPVEPDAQVHAQNSQTHPVMPEIKLEQKKQAENTPKPKELPPVKLEQKKQAENNPKPKELPPVKLEPQKQAENNPKPKELPPVKREQTSEMDAIFEDFAEHGEERKQVILEELCAQMQSLPTRDGKKRPEMWISFLQSAQSRHMQTERAYWVAFYNCLTQQKLKENVYQALVYELERIEFEFGTQMNSDAKHMFLQCKNECVDKVEDLYRKKGRGIAPVVMIIGAIFLINAIFIAPNSELRRAGAHQSQIGEGVSTYLNEKYDTTEYQEDEFEMKKISGLVAGKWKDMGYKITSTAHEELRAYAIFQYEDADEIKSVVYFDNLQRGELEAGLEKQISDVTGLVEGSAYLAKGEKNIFASGSTEVEDAVYHTLFTEDLDSFWEEEYTVRKNLAEGSEYSYYDDLDINGAVVFYYPDEQVQNISALLERQNASYEDTFASELMQMQNEMHMAVVVAGMPQSYYHALFDGNARETENENVLYQRATVTDERPPFEPAFISAWYAQGESDTEWLHVSSPLQSEEGVYVFLEKDYHNELGTLEIEIDEANKEITIHRPQKENVRYGVTEYGIVLDMEKLGIDGTYRAALRDADSELEYRQYEYSNLTGIQQDFYVLEGENLLFMDFCATSENDVLVFQWD